MWSYEHAADTQAPSTQVWTIWTDVESWPAWNAGVAAIADGPFTAGTRFTMTPPGEDPIAMQLAEVRPGESFTDVMDAGDFTVTTVHRLEPLPTGGTRITYRTEIAGPAAEAVGPELGPAITADFPDVLAALATRAEQQPAPAGP
jgi:uncharacterized protein YndB with AHSA1/START domain